MALALSACDDGGEPEPTNQAPAAENPGDEALVDEARAELGLGDQGPEVAAAHAYLHRFGYFPNPELAAQYPGWTPVIDVEPEDPELFDLTLEEALASYQQDYGLPVTGRLDAATLALMQQPRCGHPDHHASARPEPSVAAAGEAPSVDDPSAPGDALAVSVDPSEYQYFPNSLTYTDLRYGIASYSGKLDPGWQDAEVYAAT